MMQQLPLLLYGCAIASMAWSHAAHSAISLVATLILITTKPKINFFPTYGKILIVCSAAILFAFAVSPSKESAWNDIKGLWPLAHLLIAPYAVQKGNVSQMINLLAVIGGLGAVASLMQWIGWLPQNSISNDGGKFVNTSHMWAFCISMNTIIIFCYNELWKRNYKEKCFFLTVTLLALLAIWANQGRANFLLALMSLIWISFNQAGIKIHLKAIWILSILGLGFLLLNYGDKKINSLIERSSLAHETSSSIRQAHWESAFDSFKEKPWLGHGLGAYPILAKQHPIHGELLKPYVEQGQIWSHNTPLQILATTGIVGLLLIFILGVKILAPFIINRKTCHAAFTIGTSACLIHYGGSMTDTPSLQSVRLAAFTITIAICYGMQQRSHISPSK